MPRLLMDYNNHIHSDNFSSRAWSSRSFKWLDLVENPEAVDVNFISMSALSLDDYKGEIFQLYPVEKKKLADVMAIIEETHGITTT